MQRYTKNIYLQIIFNKIVHNPQITYINTPKKVSETIDFSPTNDIYLYRRYYNGNMKATEFLTYAGQQYETNKKKWRQRIKKLGYTFSEDIYNDSIIKVYDNINKDKLNINEDNIENYWYISFLNNTKREDKYSSHTKKDDTIDVYAYLDTIPDELPSVYTFQKDNSITEQQLHLFLIYNLTDITYKELEQLTNITDIKYKIKKITTKMNAYKQQDS
jgi:hypothetical protein